jgi:hypothetical protein
VLDNLVDDLADSNELAEKSLALEVSARVAERVRIRAARPGLAPHGNGIIGGVTPDECDALVESGYPLRGPTLQRAVTCWSAGVVALSIDRRVARCPDGAKGLPR